MKTAAQLLTEDRLWRVKDAAYFLQVSTSQVYKLAEAGYLPARRIGASLRFDPHAVKAFGRGDAPRADVIALAPKPDERG